MSTEHRARKEGRKEGREAAIGQLEMQLIARWQRYYVHRKRGKKATEYKSANANMLAVPRVRILQKRLASAKYVG